MELEQAIERLKNKIKIEKENILDNEAIEILLKDYKDYKDKINKIIDYVDLQINLLIETINGYRYDDKIVDKNIIALFKKKCEYIKRILNNAV